MSQKKPFDAGQPQDKAENPAQAQGPKRPEEPKDKATGVTRDGGTENTAPAAGYYKTDH